MREFSCGGLVSDRSINTIIDTDTDRNRSDSEEDVRVGGM
jgi:hypothetical protein